MHLLWTLRSTKVSWWDLKGLFKYQLTRFGPFLTPPGWHPADTLADPNHTPHNPPTPGWRISLNSACRERDIAQMTYQQKVFNWHKILSVARETAMWYNKSIILPLNHTNDPKKNPLKITLYFMKSVSWHSWWPPASWLTPGWHIRLTPPCRGVCCVGGGGVIIHLST